MPILNVDAKALEWMCALHLSQDPVGIEEWNSRVDIHAVNQKDFDLPSRLIAKIYLFRLIFGGSAYAYAQDNDFIGISSKPEFWQAVINRTYRKYTGLARWHEALEMEVRRTGQLAMPTGRIYRFTAQPTIAGPKWPRSQILNYPVQGLGADLMMLARIDLYRKLLIYRKDIKFISTVHDSVVLDVPHDFVNYVVSTIRHTWDRLPRLYTEIFKQPWKLECRCEISIGDDLGHLEELKDAQACT